MTDTQEQQTLDPTTQETSIHILEQQHVLEQQHLQLEQLMSQVRLERAMHVDNENQQDPPAPGGNLNCSFAPICASSFK